MERNLIAGRLQRAQTNFQETFPLFAALVLVAHLVGATGLWSEIGAVVYLSGRAIAEGVPDLVVEILSPSTRKRDLGLKARLYEQFGVPHYRLVDPERKSLTARELREEGYVTVEETGKGGCFEPRLFPGLQVEVDALFKDFS